MFGETPRTGNPLAVVHDADGLSDEEMAAFARWTNLSETSFILPPTDPAADYRVRIFTPIVELPFAGHPTLGTCHAWLEAGGSPRESGVVVQECPAGLIRIARPDSGPLAFAEPPIVRGGPVDEATVQHLAELLRIDRSSIVDSQWVDNGPGWVAVLLENADAVLALRPGVVDIDLGVVGPFPAGSPFAYEIRAFMPYSGATVEDPVTGSLNASVAGWLTRSGRVAPPYVASQGTAMQRAGRIQVTQDADGTIWVGGATATVIEGEVDL